MTPDVPADSIPADPVAAARAQADAALAALRKAQEDAEAAVRRAEEAAAQAAAEARGAAPPPPATPPSGPLDARQVDAIRAGYGFDGPALELGALVNGDALP